MTPSLPRPASAHPRCRAFRPLLCAGLLALVLPVAACQHRDGVDTTIDAAHALMGGEASRLHPPTPGYDRPPPEIAFIPTRVPDLPSAEARTMITNRLVQDRNATQRIAASGGALPIGMVNPPPPHTQASGSMTIGSRSNGPTAASPATSRGLNAGRTAPAGEAPTGPGLIYQPIAHAIPIHLPDPGQPPRPLLFPGFQSPDTALPVIPDLETADPEGMLIRFQPGTDLLAPDQNDRLEAIVAQRHRHRLVISGFGTTLTAQTGLGPDDQAHAITLALLRARAVASQLGRLGVPGSDMRLTGAPLGDGVRVSYEKNPHPGAQ